MAAITIDDNIVIRSYTEEDAVALFYAVNGSRQHLRPWLNWVDNTRAIEDSLEYIKGSIYEMSVQKSLAFGIFYNEKLMGEIAMHEWKQDIKKAQIGYWVCYEFEGRGIVKKCLVKFIDYLFDKTGINKLEIQFVPANKRSAKVAERLGFRIEGIIRQSILRNGLLEDIVITGILKSEWYNIVSRTNQFRGYFNFNK